MSKPQDRYMVLVHDDEQVVENWQVKEWKDTIAELRRALDAAFHVDAVTTLNVTIAEHRDTIETLRTWLNAVEWGVPGLRCPMCRRTEREGHGPQCNWVEDRAALGEEE